VDERDSVCLPSTVPHRPGSALSGPTAGLSCHYNHPSHDAGGGRDVYGGRLASLYFARWGIETNLGHLKTTMGLAVLKCHTVDGVLKELIVFALIYNLVRLVMWEAARRQRVDVERVSFIDAARWLASARDDEPLPTLVANPHRPYRYEPRVRKRRPKPYPLMTMTRQDLRKLLTNNINVD
jgi:hypothetical protein